MIRVLIVDDSVTIRATLEQALNAENDFEIVGSVGSGEEALAAVPSLNPDIVLMDIMMPGINGIEVTRQLASTHPTAVIIMSTRSESDSLQEAMQAGAREYLIKPSSATDVLVAARRVYALDQRRTSHLVRQPESSQQLEPETFAIFSAKGGVGRSLIAVNLASAIAQATEGLVALLDFDLLFGDVGVLLNLDVSRTISDLSLQEGLEQDLIETMQTGSRGVEVLLAPPRPELAETVTLKMALEVISIAKRKFDFVIFDLATTFSEINLAAVDATTKLVVLMTPTIASVVHTKTALMTFEALDIPASRIVVVVNHLEHKTRLSIAEIEESLGRSIDLEILHDPKVVEQATANGRPFVDKSPEAEISRRIRDLVGLLVSGDRQTAANISPQPIRHRLFARS